MTCYIDPTSCLSWDALFPYVLPYTLGMPDELMAHHIRLSCIEFCRRSGILHDANEFDLQSHVSDYFLTTVCEFEIVRVFEVVFHRLWRCHPSVTKPINRFCAGPYQFWMENVDVIHLSAMPTTNDIEKGLRVEFIVQPKQDGCILDNYLYEYWAEAIAYGAIHRILLLPNTGWFNPNLSKEFMLKYRAELARARSMGDMNFTSGSIEMTTRRWV